MLPAGIEPAIPAS